MLFDLISNFIDMMLHVPQAEKPSWNSIGICKVSNIPGKTREPVPRHETNDSGMNDEDSDSEDDSEDEEEGVSGGPTLQATSSSFEFLLFHLITF